MIVSLVGEYCTQSHWAGARCQLGPAHCKMRDRWETLTAVVVSGRHERAACWNSCHSSVAGRCELCLMETWRDLLDITFQTHGQKWWLFYYMGNLSIFMLSVIILIEHMILFLSFGNDFKPQQLLKLRLQSTLITWIGKINDNFLHWWFSL